METRDLPKSVDPKPCQWPREKQRSQSHDREAEAMTRGTSQGQRLAANNDELIRYRPEKEEKEGVCGQVRPEERSVAPPSGPQRPRAQEQPTYWTAPNEAD